MIRYRYCTCISLSFARGAPAENAGVRLMRRYSFSLLVLAAVSLLAACQNKTSPDSTSSAPQTRSSDQASGKSSTGRAVTVATTLTHAESVPLILEAQGNTLALDEVDVRPQKNGMITTIHVKEGDEVHKGQLLFSLDSRDDDANVVRATAAVATTQAAEQIAERDLKRNQELSDRNFISPSALDTYRNRLDTANAQLAQNKAALEQARVSQSYNRIYAPFDSRVGIISVRPGSLVTSTASSPALVHLTRMDPIGVSFTLTERDMAPLLEALKHTKSIKLTALTAAQDKLKGEINYVDSAVDRTSGTLLVKGILDNGSRLIRPGQYVTVKVQAGEIADAVVIPSQAVVNGPNGRFVYVVQDDHTVKPQPITLVRIYEQRAVITGIGSNVKIVLEGTQNLRPGSRIQETHDDAGGKGRGKGAGKAEGSAASGNEASAKAGSSKQ